MNNYLEKFIKYLKFERGYSDNTIINYEEDINEFIDYLNESHVSFDKLTYQDIKPYLMKLHELKYKRSTISRKISSLRSFYRYLTIENIIDDNPFLLVSLPKKEKKITFIFIL